MNKERKVNNWGAMIIVGCVLVILYWANQPAVAPEQDYTLPPISGEVKGFNYGEHRWDYYEKQQQRTYTQSQVDSIRRYAKNMKADDFEELLEDAIEEEASWGK